MKMAIGMVAAIVNVPHGLPFSAFTTTSATTASRMTMISSTVTSADEAAHFADLLARHLPQRFPVAPHGSEQNHEVLHAPPRHGADDDPQRPRQVSELRRQHRSDQRPRTGDGGEVMAEHDPFIGRLEIVPVAQAFRRCGALVVQRHHARRDELAIKAEGRARNCTPRPAPARSC